MYCIYLPTFTIKVRLNVGKYTISIYSHGYLWVSFFGSVCPTATISPPPFSTNPCSCRAVRGLTAAGGIRSSSEVLHFGCLRLGPGPGFGAVGAVGVGNLSLRSELWVSKTSEITSLSGATWRAIPGLDRK